MEKRTTQRVIGTLVVIALVIILLPLLFGNSATTTQTAATHEPSFPEKPVQQATPTQQQSAEASPTSAAAATTTPSPVVNEANNGNASLTPAAELPVNNSTNQTGVIPAKAIEPATPQPANPIPQEATAVQAAPEPPVEMQKEPEAAGTQDLVIPASSDDFTTSPETTPEKKAAKTTHKILKPAMTHQADVAQLKNKAWVVQLGAFKVKTNAVRLANKLRASGYKAFTREVKNATRVYVGPQFKRTTAVALVTQLEQKTSIRGIVLPYKPLVL